MSRSDIRGDLFYPHSHIFLSIAKVEKVLHIESYNIDHDSEVEQCPQNRVLAFVEH